MKKEPEAETTYRIAKRLADLGVASRRECEALILEGRIKINNFKITEASHKVKDSDVILINNKPITNVQPKTKLFIFNKPKGCITSSVDPQNRATIFDFIPAKLGRLISIGRLDYNTEGLLLLTNSGSFAREMELPSNNIIRIYKAKVFGYIDQKRLARLGSGSKVEGIKYGMFKVIVNRTADPYSLLTVKVSEGKNREVKRVLASVGLKVVELERIQYGPYKLKGISRGAIEEVKKITSIDQIDDKFKQQQKDFKHKDLKEKNFKKKEETKKIQKITATKNNNSKDKPYQKRLDHRNKKS
jgi:23S rRNA pseudouridine2605 synthase